MGKSVYFLVKLHQLLPRNKLNSSSLLSFRKVFPKQTRETLLINIASFCTYSILLYLIKIYFDMHLYTVYGISMYLVEN